MGFWSTLFGKTADPVATTKMASSQPVPRLVIEKQPQGEWTSPIDADGENFLANFLMERGNAEAAIVAYETCYSENPNHPDILFNLASAYRRSGRFGDAELVARQMLAKNPNDDDALYALERCQSKDSTGSEEWDEARRVFAGRTLTAADEAHPAWPGVVVVERTVPISELGVRPPKFNIATSDGNGQNFYDLMLNITLANGQMCKFRLHRAIPELRALVKLGNKERARVIGEKLHEQGGFALMLGVGEILNIVDKDARIFCDRIAFPGVGPWQG